MSAQPYPSCRLWCERCGRPSRGGIICEECARAQARRARAIVDASVDRALRDMGVESGQPRLFRPWVM